MTGISIRVMLAFACPLSSDKIQLRKVSISALSRTIRSIHVLGTWAQKNGCALETSHFLYEVDGSYHQGTRMNVQTH